MIEEKTFDDAPIHLDSQAAQAWLSGYDCAKDAADERERALNYEIEYLKREILYHKNRYPRYVAHYVDKASRDEDTISRLQSRIRSFRRRITRLQEKVSSVWKRPAGVAYADRHGIQINIPYEVLPEIVDYTTNGQIIIENREDFVKGVVAYLNSEPVYADCSRLQFFLEESIRDAIVNGAMGCEEK